MFSLFLHTQSEKYCWELDRLRKINWKNLYRVTVVIENVQIVKNTYTR